MRIFSASPGRRRAEGKRRGTGRVTVLIKRAGEGEGAGRPEAEKRKCSLVTPMARGSPWLTGPQRALFIYTGARNVSRPGKGREEEKGKRPCVPVEKSKNPALESANLNHSPEGTPDATLSGQSGKLRQDAATVMKYSCLPTGNLECLSTRRRCREGGKNKSSR